MLQGIQYTALRHFLAEQVIDKLFRIVLARMKENYPRLQLISLFEAPATKERVFSDVSMYGEDNLPEDFEVGFAAASSTPHELFLLGFELSMCVSSCKNETVYCEVAIAQVHRTVPPSKRLHKTSVIERRRAEPGSDSYTSFRVLVVSNNCVCLQRKPQRQGVNFRRKI